MADTTRRICEVCGASKREWDMKSFYTGRKTHYICTECFRKTNDDVIYHEIHAKKRFKGAEK